MYPYNNNYAFFYFLQSLAVLKLCCSSSRCLSEIIR